jgi:hypothetical protein
MSQERWRPSWLENKPDELPSDTPEYWQQQFPDMKRQEAEGIARVVQLGDAAEMFEYIQYDNLDESPYFQENPESS